MSRKRKTNVEQSDVYLSLLVLPCSRILLVQGGVYCLPCGGWALVQMSKEGLEAALALKPSRAEALGGHYECLRNKPASLSSPAERCQYVTGSVLAAVGSRQEAYAQETLQTLELSVMSLKGGRNRGFDSSLRKHY